MDTSTKLYDYVMAHLRTKRIPQKQVALESGVPFSTVCKIAQGYVTDPSVHTVQRLADYFAGSPRRKESFSDVSTLPHPLPIKNGDLSEVAP